jgi:hypothetical protein
LRREAVSWNALVKPRSKFRYFDSNPRTRVLRRLSSPTRLNQSVFVSASSSPFQSKTDGTGSEDSKLALASPS